MKFSRSSGILLHPTSFPGPYGIGDLGPEAYDWLDFLAGAGCRLWQVLPLGPTGYGDSPYQSFSTFAGNHYLISPILLLQDGLLTSDELIDPPNFPQDKVDFGRVIPWKTALLKMAYSRHKTTGKFFGEIAAFEENHKHWLREYAMFMALKEMYQGAPWVEWPEDLCKRKPDALKAAQENFRDEIGLQVFQQFIFFKQWGNLLHAAHERKIKIIGDIPIYVSQDSADVWANPELYYLDDNGFPTVVAGVPPDYFAPTGQLWGNPIYRWELHAEDLFLWWRSRISHALTLVDIVRLDHFRGFSGYWEVQAGNSTAEHGRWVPGPGSKLFQTLKDHLGDLPLIAEDLGNITPDVIALREKFDLPGMRILQFAFSGDPDHDFLPHRYPHDVVVYTGTHDNQTARGWYETADEGQKLFAKNYLGVNGDNISWYFIKALWASNANMALAPMQDLLNLNDDARMNYPGNPFGNWMWRMPPHILTKDLKDNLASLNLEGNRSA